MPGLRFSVFELDQSSGELTRQGRRVAIAPQPFKVLWLLSSRAGHVVPRSELRSLLWGNGTHVEFDRSLNFCIAEARRSLGDSARQPRFIETIPQWGYRFIAEVHSIERDLPEAAPRHVSIATAPVAPASARWRQWVWAVAVVPCLVAQSPVTAAVHTRATADPRALSAFARGQALWEEDGGGLRQSLDAFETAARIDGRFAEAHFAVAATYAKLAELRTLPQQDALRLAKVALERAVYLEDVSDSRQLLARLRLAHDWDWAGARRELLRAIELEPHATASLDAYAQLLSAQGDSTGAIGVIDRAEQLSPACDLLLFNSAALHYRARRYGEALAKLERAQRSGPPGDRPIHDWLRAVHELSLLIRVQQGDWVGARGDAVALMPLSGGSARDVDRILTSDPRSAVSWFFMRSVERSRLDAVRGTGSLTQVARLAVLAGHREEALAWMERAVRDRDADVVYALGDPAFDELRRLPRFAALERIVRFSTARGVLD